MKLAIQSRLRGRARHLFVPVGQLSSTGFPIEVTRMCLPPFHFESQTNHEPGTQDEDLMNPAHNNNDRELAAIGFDGRGNLPAVDMVRSLRRRNSDGDTTGSPPNHDAARTGPPQRLATVVALTVALVLAGCGKQPAKSPEKSLVRATTVESLDNVRSDGEASYLAIVKFDNETDLNFKVGGIVVNIGPGTGWDEGTPVKAGAVLAELKQSDFKNALDSARAKSDLAGKTLERFRNLREKDAISQQELDVAEADSRTARAQLDQAEQNLRDARLVAAKDGVVLARHVNSGVTVSPGQKVLRFADTSLMSVELGLPDRLVGKLSPGQEIEVEISALEGMPPFKGRVSEVGVAASGEGRLFRVVIKVPNQDGLLRSGMTARIHMNDAAGVKPGTVVVPLSALVTFAPGTQVGVFVVQNGKAVKRLVKTGDILNSSILIAEGLRAGEQVVTAGASLLYDGAPIIVAGN